jgi:UDP-3-O-[3-hydroxymyristoyl] glucosamine N-acyltransferase
LNLLTQTQASLLIVDQKIKINEAVFAKCSVQALIRSENARLDFIRVVDHFFSPARPTGVHPSAVIAQSAVMGSGVSVGALCSIGNEVKISENTVIYPGVHVYDQVRIGCNGIIHSGTVIGKDGWGYERNETGKLERFPHIGLVEIGDDVEIGANVTVDRAALGTTAIGDGCKINNGTHIGHNVKVDKNTIILPHAYLGGSSKVGERCWVGPKATIRNKIEIGSDVFIGMGAIVTKNVPSGATVMGAPAREVTDQKKLQKYWNQVIAQANQR